LRNEPDVGSGAESEWLAREHAVSYPIRFAFRCQFCKILTNKACINLFE
jgi:hypothetical protein